MKKLFALLMLVLPVMGMENEEDVIKKEYVFSAQKPKNINPAYYGYYFLSKDKSLEALFAHNNVGMFKIHDKEEYIYFTQSLTKDFYTKLYTKHEMVGWFFDAEGRKKLSKQESHFLTKICDNLKIYPTRLNDEYFDQLNNNIVKIFVSGLNTTNYDFNVCYFNEIERQKGLSFLISLEKKILQ